MQANDLQHIIREVFPTAHVTARSVSGGDINHAARVEVDGMPFFIKWNADVPDGFFAAEAYSLNLLRAAGAIRVPEVFRYDDAVRPAYLVLEWIEPTRPTRAFGEKFGTALANLHRNSESCYGLKLDAGFPTWPKSVTPMIDWLAFYREQRLGMEVQRARDQKLLSPDQLALLESVLARLDEILGGVRRMPSLMHGDLWGGNFLVAAHDQPVLIDPLVYYGDRELELAYSQLFGGFPAGFYEAYDEAYPIEPGFDYRRPIYQLYHLLRHFIRFGEGYWPATERACCFYGESSRSTYFGSSSSS